MDRYYKIGMAFGLWLLAVGVSKADDYKTNTFNPVEHAVISQTIAPDARAAGMGDVGAATDPDVNSQHWNLAKYPFCISRAGVSLNYTPWLRQLVNDIDLAYVTGYYRVGDYGALSGSLRYFSLGTVYTDGAGEDESSTVKPYEMALDVAYSRMLSDHFSLGVGLRWIYSDLRYDYSEDSKPASAFSADIAMYYNNYVMLGSRECQLGFGATVTNIGSKISYYGDEESQFMGGDATKYHEGLYHEYVRNTYSDISSIKGIIKSFSDAPGGFKEELEEIQWSVGAEYVYNDQFSLRAGYHHESESKGNRKYFTVGGGFRMNVFSLDVGYVISTAQSNPLDQTLRFTLAFDMDGIKDLFK